MIDDRARDAGFRGEGQACGIRPIAHDVRDRAVDVAAPRGVDQRAQVRSAAGNQDGDARERHGSISTNTPSFRQTRETSSFRTRPQCGREPESILTFR